MTRSCRTARVAAAVEPFDTPFPVPEYPPRDWFTEPPDWVEGWRLDHGLGPSRDSNGILRLTVTDEGRVGGYFFDDGQCIVHMPNACPTPSPTGYAAFHQNDVITEDGQALCCGVIGNVHGHASPMLDWQRAQAHYADPSSQMILCRAGDDERGGWIAGAVIPGLTYGDVAMLRRCGLSGDWRPMPSSWWKEHGVAASVVRRSEGFDCIGPTLVTRPALPLVKRFAAPGLRAAAILGGTAGVQLEEDDDVFSAADARAAAYDESLHPRAEHGRFGEKPDTEAPSGPEGTPADRFIAGEKGIVLPADDVATFTDRLAEFGRQEKERGEGTRLNLCEVSVPGTNLFCGDNQGIPRQEMPQLKGQPEPGSPAEALPRNRDGEVDITPGFLDKLRANGSSITEDSVPAESLKSTQNELVGEKVAGIAEAIRAGKLDIAGGDRIVVTKDNYILDGHHRWAGAVLNDAEDGHLGDSTMPVYRVDMGILDLVDAANTYANDEGIAQKGTKQGAIMAAGHDENAQKAVAGAELPPEVGTVTLVPRADDPAAVDSGPPTPKLGDAYAQVPEDDAEPAQVYYVDDHGGSSVPVGLVEPAGPSDFVAHPANGSSQSFTSAEDAIRYVAQDHVDSRQGKDQAALAAPADGLPQRLRALSQELAVGQHRSGANPGKLMSALLSAASQLDRGDEARAAERLDGAVGIAEKIERDHPALKGTTAQIRAMADELSGTAQSTDTAVTASTVTVTEFYDKQGVVMGTRIETPDGTTVEVDGSGEPRVRRSPAQARAAAAAARTAGPGGPPAMDMENAQDPMPEEVPEDAGPPTREEFDALASRVQALEDNSDAALSAEIASICDHEVPLPPR